MERERGDSTGFLLSQIGVEATRRFAERVAELEVTPPQAGLLRLVARLPGLSQQAIAGRLGTPPSRLVALLDQLERRGLVERRRNPDDRRLHSLHVTEAGTRTLDAIGRVAHAHDDAICAGLDAAERATLHALLTRVATELGLCEGVHPGYRLRPDDRAGPRTGG